MILTILLPTRQRIKGLLNVLDTAKDTWDKYYPTQVLVKFDEDDVETREQWNQVREKYNSWVRTFVWQRGRGYLDLYKYNNTLASFANQYTEWFLIMNDDAHFTKKKWNAEIFETNGVGLNTPKIFLDSCELFPCVNRAAYGAMGTISKGNHADTYLKMVGEQANCLDSVNIGIVHEAHKFEDTVRREGQAVYGKEWDEHQKLIEGDAKKIREYTGNPWSK